MEALDLDERIQSAEERLGPFTHEQRQFARECLRMQDAYPGMHVAFYPEWSDENPPQLTRIVLATADTRKELLSKLEELEKQDMITDEIRKKLRKRLIVDPNAPMVVRSEWIE